MLPQTLWLNKHLIGTGGGKLMIDHPLATLKATGFDEVILVTGTEHAGQLSEHVGDGERHGFKRVSYAIQSKPAGIADVVRRASHFMGDHNGMVLILGDNYFSLPQLPLPDRNNAVAWQYPVESPERAQSFGQVVMREGKPAIIVEKSTQPIHCNILTGLYYLPRDVVNVVTDIKPSGRGELEITDLLGSYLEQGRLEVRQVKGTWADLGEWSSWASFVRAYG